VVCPAVYHEFPEGSAPYAYDGPGTDLGNDYKVKKPLKNYDDDSKATIDYLMAHPNCNQRIGATGMCLGGHLAFRSALDPRVKAAQCYFPTDSESTPRVRCRLIETAVHSETLGEGGSDSLIRAKEIQAELVLIFGLDDSKLRSTGDTSRPTKQTTSHSKAARSFAKS
jgi:carboxymethylenebutenolidase